MVKVMKEYKGVIIFYLILAILLFSLGLRYNQIDAQTSINCNIVDEY